MCHKHSQACCRTVCLTMTRTQRAQLSESIRAHARTPSQAVDLSLTIEGRFCNTSSGYPGYPSVGTALGPHVNRPNTTCNEKDTTLRSICTQCLWEQSYFSSCIPRSLLKSLPQLLSTSADELHMRYADSSVPPLLVVIFLLGNLTIGLYMPYLDLHRNAIDILVENSNTFPGLILHQVW